jgi:hypothetical protein
MLRGLFQPIMRRPRRMATAEAAMKDESADKEENDLMEEDTPASRWLVFKIDLLLMPLLTFSYGLQFVSGTALDACRDVSYLRQSV